MDNEVDGRPGVVDQRSPDVADSDATHAKNCSACPDAKATSFCVDCQEYLCSDCTNYHQRLGALRKHILLTGENFPPGDPPTGTPDKADIIEKCQDHPKKEIEFYCVKHDALCCVACTVLNHEQCTKTYIPDIAEDFKNGTEYKSLNTDIDDSERLIVKSIVDVDECLKAVETLNVGELEKLRQYKATIIEYLDRREQELQAEMQQLHTEDVALLQELQIKLKTCQSVLNDMREKLKTHEKNSSELFVSAKRMCGQMTKLQASLKEMTKTIGYRQYSTLLDPKIKNILQDQNGVAGVELISDLYSAKFTRQPDMKLDVKNLKMTDMVLISDNKLLLSDENVGTLALVDIKSNNVVSKIELRKKPSLVCKIDKNRAATTAGNEIQFLQIEANALRCDLALTSGEDAYQYGIASQGNNLVVTYVLPPGVRIISTDGKIIHKLDNTTAGKELFKQPRWIATTSDGSIYVTDWGTHKITRLDSSLAILQTFSGSLLRGPHGIIALNRDQLLVCNKSNNNILLIRPSTNSMTVLLDDGIEKPQSICFCNEQKKLYVASEDDKVMVYQLSSQIRE